jgi:hypothetical protein
MGLADEEEEQVVNTVIMDPRQAAYYQYYVAQRGGQLPVFRGGRQGGEGLGDFFRGILRFIAPIALRGLTTFAGKTLDAHQQGASLADAAKSAIKPTLQSVGSSISDRMQSGSGSVVKRNVYKKRRRKINFVSNGQDSLHRNF